MFAIIRTRWQTRPLSRRAKRRSSAAPVRCERSTLASPIPQTWYACLITLPHLGIPGSPYKILVYQVLPSRYGFDPNHLRACEAIEIVVGQGAKPGGGGMLLGQKITERVAQMRTLPAGIDQRSACRHPDWTGPDDLTIKIRELRELTDWEKPVFVKIGSARPRYDGPLAVNA